MKTKLQILKEKFPQVKLSQLGYPSFFPIDLGMCGETKCENCPYRHKKDWPIFSCWDLIDYY